MTLDYIARVKKREGKKRTKHSYVGAEAPTPKNRGAPQTAFVGGIACRCGLFPRARRQPALRNAFVLSNCAWLFFSDSPFNLLRKKLRESYRLENGESLDSEELGEFLISEEEAGVTSPRSRMRSGQGG